MGPAGAVVASLLIKMGLDASEVEAGAQKVSTSVSGIGKTVMKGAGIVAAGALGIAAKGALQAEDAMARFQAETGATAEEARRVYDSINAMSGGTTASFDQLSETAMKVRTDLGLVGDEADAMVARMAKYEVATRQGAEATLAFDDILDAWNLEASAAPGIMDVLIASHQKYGGSIADNQRILAALAPTLQAANMNWEQGQALLNLFARAGVSGEAATTAFNRALSKVKSPEEMQTLLEQISAEPDAFKRAQLAADLFGNRVGTKLSQALSDANGDLDAFMVTTEDAAGATEKASAAIEGTFKAQVTKAIKTAEAALRGFGMAFGPALTGAASLATLASQLGLGKVMRAIGAKWGAPLMAGLASGIKGIEGVLSRAMGPAMDGLGKVMGGRFGMAFKAAALLAAALVIADLAMQLGELRQKNIETASANSEGMKKLLESAPSRAEAEKTLEGLKAIPDNLDDVQSAVYQFSDFADGNVLGSAVDALFGANPAQNLKQQIADLEAYIATLPPEGTAMASDVKAMYDPLASVVVDEADKVAQVVSRSWKEIKRSVDAGASRISGAWDAITNALSKGPKVESMKARLRDATKAIRYNARQLARAIKTGDVVAAADYSARLVSAKSARHALRANAEGTLADASAVLAQHRRMNRRKYQEVTTDTKRETGKARRQTESDAKKAAESVPKAIRSKESATRSAAEATGRAATQPLETAATQATTYGSHLGANFASGIMSQVAAAQAASNALAAAASKNITFSDPPPGPLRGIRTWGKHLVSEWTAPIERSAGKAERTGAILARRMSRGLRVAPQRSTWNVDSIRTRGVRAETDERRGRSGGGDTYHFHIGALIANDQGIDELQRRMDHRTRMRSRTRRHYNDTDG